MVAMWRELAASPMTYEPGQLAVVTSKHNTVAQTYIAVGEPELRLRWALLLLLSAPPLLVEQIALPPAALAAAQISPSTWATKEVPLVLPAMMEKTVVLEEPALALTRSEVVTTDAVVLEGVVLALT